tara:strand:- start:28836 stop:29099 length:264 start_codon:yes stop_codon:yes gene_type:complete
MWIEKKVNVGKITYQANVNIGEDTIEVELPYFDKWLSCLNEEITIDKDSYTISNLTNVGDRDEVIKILIRKEKKQNEHKHVKSRKDT